MIIDKEIKIDDLSFYESIPEKALCFDIETTGLSRKFSHTTVIGTGYVKDGYIAFKQWLLDDPAKEKEMLSEFSRYISGFERIIQFNGNSFDIPYVRERCLIHGLDDPFSDMELIDFYTGSKKYRKLLGLEDMKQKSLETLFKINRLDRISGGDCITAYERYISYGDLNARDALLLHNEEDVIGLLKINGLGVLHRIGSDSGMLGIHSTYAPEADPSSFVIEFTLSERLPFTVDYRTGTHTLQLKNKRGILHLKGCRCRRKYFFPNPKDYFYLPAEDHAIHKSVGIYVDRENRCKATRENCYEPSEDIFFFQPRDILSPALRETYKDKCSWINSKTLLKASKGALADLIREYINT